MSTTATQVDDVGQQTRSDPTAIRPFQKSFPEGGAQPSCAGE